MTSSVWPVPSSHHLPSSLHCKPGQCLGPVAHLFFLTYNLKKAARGDWQNGKVTWGFFFLFSIVCGEWVDAVEINGVTIPRKEFWWPFQFFLSIMTWNDPRMTSNNDFRSWDTNISVKRLRYFAFWNSNAETGTLCLAPVKIVQKIVVFFL